MRGHARHYLRIRRRTRGMFTFVFREPLSTRSFVMWVLLIILVGLIIVVTQASFRNQVSRYYNSAKSYFFSSGVTPNGKPLGLALGDTATFMNPQQLQQQFSTISKIGATWVRVDFSWADVQQYGPGQYDWRGLDRVVNMANRYHLKILGTIAYTPSWAASPVCNTSQDCAPASDSQFASYAAAVASRYAPRGVHTWEIWNEPNLEGFWQPTPSPRGYTQLLAVSYTAIKHVDQHSLIMSGGLGALDNSPRSINQVAFLSGMYAYGARPYFDAVAFHPYSFPALPTFYADWNSWSMMNALPDSIRAVMIANGDGDKQVWVTEYGAPTGGPGALATVSHSNFTEHPDHVNDDLQAQMAAIALSQYDRNSWMGGFSGTPTGTLARVSQRIRISMGSIPSTVRPSRYYRFLRMLLPAKISDRSQVGAAGEYNNSHSFFCGIRSDYLNPQIFLCTWII